MKRSISSKLKLDLETLVPLVLEGVHGGIQTSSGRPCGPQTVGRTCGGGTDGGTDTCPGPQSSPIHTCLPR